MIAVCFFKKSGKTWSPRILLHACNNIIRCHVIILLHINNVEKRELKFLLAAVNNIITRG